MTKPPKSITKSVPPSAKHMACINDFKAVLAKHKDKLSATDMLAVASHLVGSLVALQDQFTITPEIAMRIVEDNIQQGNQEAVEMLSNPLNPGSMQ